MPPTVISYVTPTNSSETPWKFGNVLMEISWTYRVRNDEALHTVNEERNILHTMKRRKVNWIDYILRGNCLLKHVTIGTIKGRSDKKTGEKDVNRHWMTVRKRKGRYWKLNDEALSGELVLEEAMDLS
jgi:hypothetical protein